MAKKVIVSKQFSLSVRDWLKGALIAVGTPVAFQVQQVLDKWSNGQDISDFNWKLLAKIAVGALVVYIGKQFFSSPKVTTVYSDNEKATGIAKEIKDAQYDDK